MKRNLEKTERIKGYFLNMFRNICKKMDMKGEMDHAIKERKTLLKRVAIA